MRQTGEGIPRPWTSRDMSGAFAEREHPADLWLEIRGPDLPTLFEHGLYALYSHSVCLDDLLPLRSWRLTAWGADPAEALRALLAEALYRFDAEALTGVSARVEVRGVGAGGAEVEGPGADGVEVSATVWGEVFDPRRQAALTEIKAVTYHRLSVERDADGGWRATVLFDV